jgi:hypothetical protein
MRKIAILMALIGAAMIFPMVTASATHARFTLVPHAPQIVSPNTFRCNGTNNLDYPNLADDMLVSSICQYRNPFTNAWAKFGGPAASATKCSDFPLDQCDTVFNVDTRFCSQLPDNLWNRLIQIRTHVDGWVLDNGHKEGTSPKNWQGTAYIKCQG